MTAEVCPYCRGPLLSDEPSTECEGCGTRHHDDCYAENGGCTIFGCSKAPVDEPKLTISAPDFAAARSGSTATVIGAEPVVAPPPPPFSAETTPPISPQVSLDNLRRVSSLVVPSMFGLSDPDPDATILPDPEPLPVPEGPPKSRTTYILLGALLGALGAHNFYAGYKKKAIGQLAITVVSIGFASPMSWIWALIDICTVSHDVNGVQFES